MTSSVILPKHQPTSPLHRLPEEMQMMIFSYLPSQPLTLLSKTCCLFYDLLRRKSHLWTGARTLYPTGFEVPKPPDILWVPSDEQERWWSYWLFGGGQCAICQEEVFLFPAIVALRVHVCNNTACLREFFDTIVPFPYIAPDGLSLSGTTSGYYPLVPHPFCLAHPLGSSQSSKALLEDFCDVAEVLMGLLTSYRNLEDQCKVGIDYIYCRSGDRGELTRDKRGLLYEHFRCAPRTNEPASNDRPALPTPLFGKISNTMFHFGRSRSIPPEVLKGASSALRACELSMPERLRKFGLKAEDEYDDFTRLCLTDTEPLRRMDDLCDYFEAWFENRDDAAAVRALVTKWEVQALSTQALMGSCREVQLWWTRVSIYSGLVKDHNQRTISLLAGNCLSQCTGALDTAIGTLKLPEALLISNAHTNDFSKLDYCEAVKHYEAKLLRDARLLFRYGHLVRFGGEQHARDKTSLRCYHCETNGITPGPFQYESLKQHMKSVHRFVDIMRFDVLLPDEYKATDSA